MLESIRAYFYLNDTAISEKPIKISYDHKVEYWDWVARECLYNRRQRDGFEDLQYVSHRLGFTYADSKPYRKIGEEDRKNYNLYIICEPASIENSSNSIDNVVYVWLKDQRGKKYLISFGKINLHSRMYAAEIIENNIQEKLIHVTNSLKMNQVYGGNDVFMLEEICPYYTMGEVNKYKDTSHLLFYCEISDLSYPDSGDVEMDNRLQGFWPTLMIRWIGQNYESVYPLPEFKLTEDTLKWSTEQLRNHYMEQYVPETYRDRMHVSIWKGDPLDRIDKIEIKPDKYVEVLNQEMVWIRVT